MSARGKGGRGAAAAAAAEPKTSTPKRKSNSKASGKVAKAKNSSSSGNSSPKSIPPDLDGVPGTLLAGLKPATKRLMWKAHIYHRSINPVHRLTLLMLIKKLKTDIPGIIQMARLRRTTTISPLHAKMFYEGCGQKFYGTFDKVKRPVKGAKEDKDDA